MFLLLRRRKVKDMAIVGGFDYNTVEAAIRQVLPDREQRLCIVDTRQLTKPTERMFKIHMGTHPANFSACVYSQPFQSVVRPAAAAMTEGWNAVHRGDFTALTIVFLCDTGLYQSIACARVCAQVVTQFPSFTLGSCLDLTPMSAPSTSCNQCEACAFWVSWWENRNMAMADAVKKWTS
jgi:hypothetical protein